MQKNKLNSSHKSNYIDQLVVLLLGILIPLSACQAPLLKEKQMLDLDYYFAKDFVQIQGKAKLPRVVQRNKPKSKATKNTKQKPEITFLSYTERRIECRKLALKNAHTKWLSITDKKWLPQSEWKLRLKLDEVAPWNDCLANAKVTQTFYDSPSGCRSLVHYKCDPRDY